MDLHGDDFKRSTRAPAKLNLFLDVLGRRGDGFHDLETLMVPVCLADHVSLVSTSPNSSADPGEIHLDVHGGWPIRSLSALPVIPAGAAQQPSLPAKKATLGDGWCLAKRLSRSGGRLCITSRELSMS